RRKAAAPRPARRGAAPPMHRRRASATIRRASRSLRADERTWARVSADGRSATTTRLGRATIPCINLDVYGSPDLWCEEKREHAKGPSVLCRAADQDAFRRSRRAGCLAWRVASLRAEVRRSGARGSRVEAIRRARSALR